MRVFVLGGTGFLGYHSIRELQRRGHEATVLALPPGPPPGLLPDGTAIHLAGLDDLDDACLLDLLRGHDAAVFAAGADDRIVPAAPAYPFFYRANVAASERFFRLARQAGVRRGAVLGSYFAHFDRAWPALRLAERHPYIRSRREQEQRSLQVALPDLQLCVLELPYIFGAMPGRTPLWKPLVSYVRAAPLLFCPRGGTNAVAVNHIGEAVAGALEHDHGGACFQVGDENIPWPDLMRRLAQAATGRRKPVLALPDAALRAALRLVARRHRAQGRESGLAPLHLHHLVAGELYFDPRPAQDALGCGRGGLDQAFIDTVRACSNTKA